MRLVLIRHAAVAIDPRVPVEEWRLSEEGLAGAERLRQHSAVQVATHFFSSTEPKALTTAHAVADGRPVAEVPALRELDRRPAGWVGSDERYEHLVEAILRNPEQRVRGCESAREATERIVQAVAAIQAPFPAIVSHGILLTLYLSHLLDRLEPDVALWRSIQFPDAAVVNTESRTLLEPFGALFAPPLMKLPPDEDDLVG